MSENIIVTKMTINSKYKNIRIKVDNEIAKQAPSANVSNSNSRVNLISSSVRRDEDEEMSMDFQEESNARSYNHKTNNIKTINNNSSSNRNNPIDLHYTSGYKLTVSNLHHKVTEDDILV